MLCKMASWPNDFTGLSIDLKKYSGSMNVNEIHFLLNGIMVKHCGPINHGQGL